METISEILGIISSKAERCIGLDILEEKLKAGKKLNVKFGVDPTRADLTFGHLVVFNKLRQLQDLGHTAILLIGDYTATIGDPSGRSSTRPPLTKSEVLANAQTYLEQAFKILDPQKTIIRYNSEWLEPLRLDEILGLCAKITVAQMIERDDFSKRFSEKSPISLVEFLYPILQGYDSVALEADLELGGNDQLFNLLMGRVLQKSFNQTQQAILCMPLLVGLDGVRKMSKSYDNYISFNDSPKDMFGKIMSISDDTMWPYYSFLLLNTEEQIADLKAMHPVLAKKNLAKSLVSLFYNQECAQEELEQFENIFSKKELPKTMPIFNWQDLCSDVQAPLIDILAGTNLFASKKELRRIIEQGGLKVNNEKQVDPFFILEKSTELVIQVGKRTFLKIVS